METLGPMLVRAGLLTQEQFLTALEETQRAGVPFLATLFSFGFVTEAKMVEFFRRRLMIPEVKTEDLSAVPPDVRALIPAEMAIRFQMVPVRLDGEGHLVVAMANPADTHAADELVYMSDLYVVRAVAKASAVQRAVEVYYGAAAAGAIEAAGGAPERETAATPAEPEIKRPAAPPPEEPQVKRPAAPPPAPPPPGAARPAPPAADPRHRAPTLPQSLAVSEEEEVLLLTKIKKAAPKRRPDAAQEADDDEVIHLLKKKERAPVKPAEPLKPRVKAAVISPFEATAPMAAIGEEIDKAIDRAGAEKAWGRVRTERGRAEPAGRAADRQPASSETLERFPSGLELAEALEPPAEKPTSADTLERFPSDEALSAAEEREQALERDLDRREQASESSLDRREPPAERDLDRRDLTTDDGAAWEIPATTDAEVSKVRRSRRETLTGVPQDPTADLAAKARVQRVQTGAWKPVPLSRPSEEPGRSLSYQVAARALDDCMTRDGVGRIAADYLNRHCKHSVFFVIRRGRLEGQEGRGPGLSNHSVRRISLSLQGPSTLSEVMASRCSFSGNPGFRPRDQELPKALGYSPEQVVMFPVSVREKAVALLYGDGVTVTLYESEVAAMLALVESAYERIILAAKGGAR